MITERRINPSGGVVKIEKLPPPEQMTDQELKKKVCDPGKPQTCKACTILDFCKYGPEYISRAERKGA